MKIVIFGASGKTGALLVAEALNAGFEVIAYVRKKESIQLEHVKLQIVEGQLNEKEKLTSIISGSDACISTLGGNSLTKHSSEIIRGIDNIVNSMEAAGTKRFVYLSSLGAGESRYYIPQPIRFLILDIMLRIPIADHNTNENRIMKSKLQWTIVQPGSLTDGSKTDTITHGSEKTKLKGSAKISRENVASFICKELTDNKYIHKSVWLQE